MNKVNIIIQYCRLNKRGGKKNYLNISRPKEVLNIENPFSNEGHSVNKLKKPNIIICNSGHLLSIFKWK